jgi:hypothetical protein
MSSEKTAPLSVAERQQALRAKREMLGLTEVRGIFLPPGKHAELKAMAKKLSAKKPPPAKESGQSEE